MADHPAERMRDLERRTKAEISLYRGSMPRVTSEALAAGLLGRATAPNSSVIQAERKVILQEALNSMEPMDREIVALRNLERLSGAETAQVLGINESAARKRYIYALVKLKDILTRIHGRASNEWA